MEKLNMENVRSYAIPGCNGDLTPAILYNPVTKCFIHTSNGYISKPSIEITPLQKMFDHLFSLGTGGDSFRAHLEVPDFKALWDEVESTLEPRFEEGEEVWTTRSSFSNGKDPVIVIAGKLVEWVKANGCNRSGEPAEPYAKREFISTRGHSSVRPEYEFHPLSTIDEARAVAKFQKQVLRDLRNGPFSGGILYHAGNLYKL